MNRRQMGASGEKLAGEFLKKRGYKIIESNFRCREGEIDIIARKGEGLVFVEVRTKTSDTFGAPEESITREKRQKLIATAMTYLTTHRDLPDDWRIDFVAVELDRDGKTKRIELIEHAIIDE